VLLATAAGIGVSVAFDSNSGSIVHEIGPPLTVAAAIVGGLIGKSVGSLIGTSRSNRR
jgi:hypothetical protein